MTLRSILGLAISVLALAACGDAPPAAAEAAAAPAAAEAGGPRTYAAKERIPVRLAMTPTADGGRPVPVRGTYRPQVVFADGQRQECAVDRGGLAELAPGGGYDVALRCRRELRLADDALSFAVVEEGREVATGTVLR